MFRRLFLDHPATVGESYAEHFGVAGRFGLTMIKGGLGALVHAFVPALCKTRGSAVAADQTQMKTVEFII
jgi:hypothetical protein